MESGQLDERQHREQRPRLKLGVKATETLKSRSYIRLWVWWCINRTQCVCACLCVCVCLMLCRLDEGSATVGSLMLMIDTRNLLSKLADDAVCPDKNTVLTPEPCDIQHLPSPAPAQSSTMSGTMSRTSWLIPWEVRTGKVTKAMPEHLQSQQSRRAS